LSRYLADIFSFSLKRLSEQNRAIQADTMDDKIVVVVAVNTRSKNFRTIRFESTRSSWASFLCLGAAVMLLHNILGGGVDAQLPQNCTVNQVPFSNKATLSSITGTTNATVDVTCNAGYSGGGTWTCGTDGLFTGSACSANIEPGGGNGFLYSDAAYAIGFTTGSMIQYSSNQCNRGNCNPAKALDFSTCVGHPTPGYFFSFHTGTGNASPSMWPMYFVIQVSTAPLGKVLNQIQWKVHLNAIGDVDMFGSNQNINSTNFNNEALFTWLGRTYFGGWGSGVPYPNTECSIRTQSFNPMNYGFRWYMIKGVDSQNASGVPYPSVGSQDPSGWAMYSLQLNTV